MIKFFSVFVFITIALTSFSQKITVSGFVKDGRTKEALIGASVVLTQSQRGTSTNQYGFFSLTANATDTIDLLISYQGYQVQPKKIFSRSNVQLDVELESASSNLSEVVVTAEEITTMCRMQEWVLLMSR